MATERNQLASELLAKVDPSIGSKPLVVVDLGAGGGGPGFTLLRHHSDALCEGLVVGCDILESHFTTARDKGTTSSKLISYVVTDAARVPLPDGCADLVMALTLFSSLDAATEAGAAAEVDRLLRNGGTFVFYDMRMWSPWNQNVHRIGVKEIKALFPGLTGEMRSTTLMPPIGTAVWNRPKLYRLLSRVPFLHSHIVAVLRKP